jgi:hypothetical protein
MDVSRNRKSSLIFKVQLDYLLITTGIIQIIDKNTCKRKFLNIQVLNLYRIKLKRYSHIYDNLL